MLRKIDRGDRRSSCKTARSAHVPECAPGRGRKSLIFFRHKGRLRWGGGADDKTRGFIVSLATPGVSTNETEREREREEESERGGVVCRPSAIIVPYRKRTGKTSLRPCAQLNVSTTLTPCRTLSHSLSLRPRL